MDTLNIIHLGIGNVGGTLRDLIFNNHGMIKEKQNLDLRYCGLFTSKSGYYYPFGFPFESSQNYKNKGFATAAKAAIEKIPIPFVLVDTTASDATLPLMMSALKRGGHVVMSNKKPLSGPQQQYDSLLSLGKYRILFETTVGAGLPVISTLKDFILTGDEVIKIQGCFSGTLGFICSAMEDGMNYSEAVKKAKELGYTEPDPRDDLSGLDVARKTLILSRVMGRKLELNDIKRKPFFPEALQDSTPDEFMEKIEDYNSEFGEKFAEAEKKGCTLRYMATIEPDSVEVALKEVPKDSPLGRLKGPDNIVTFQTKWYDKNPMVIQGPGAGVQVTAAGVLSDILAVRFH